MSFRSGGFFFFKNYVALAGVSFKVMRDESSGEKFRWQKISFVRNVNSLLERQFKTAAFG